jgi:succinate dehydrogenase / fumarate reductase membrane anchor subunit
MQDQKLWTWHLAAGLVILVLLGLHMAIMHLDAALGIFNPSGGHPIDWANVVARGQTVFFSVTYVLLLGVALFHGLYGLRNILLELAPGPGLKTVISWLLIIAGVALFVLGTWAAWAAHRVAQGGVLV